MDAHLKKEINVLEKIGNIIAFYRTSPRERLLEAFSKQNKEMALMECAKQLSGYIFSLEDQYTLAEKMYDEFVWNKVKDGETVAAAEREAKKEMPEISQYKHLLRGARDCLDIMRSHISLIKHEMNNLN